MQHEKLIEYLSAACGIERPLFVDVTKFMIEPCSADIKPAAEVKGGKFANTEPTVNQGKSTAADNKIRVVTCVFELTKLAFVTVRHQEPRIVAVYR